MKLKKKYFSFFCKKHVSLKFCPQSLLKHSLDHFEPTAMKLKKKYFSLFCKKTCFSEILPTIAFKTLTGSFWTYGNEIKEKIFFTFLQKKHVSLKFCPQSLLKHSLDHFEPTAMKLKKKYFHFFWTYAKKTCFSEILPTIAFKTLTGSFWTYGNEIKEKIFFTFLQKNMFLWNSAHNRF